MSLLYVSRVKLKIFLLVIMSTTNTIKQDVSFPQIIFNSLANQNGANVIYQNRQQYAVPKQFKSDYERMQYETGRQQQASCGVPGPKRVTTNPNQVLNLN
jgi:hypothetical protein